MDSQVIVASGRRCQRPFTRRLLDLPWEDVLLPHVLNRVPLCQLLRLQRVSRAFRALVQLHLAGLRRFDAAQVGLQIPRAALAWLLRDAEGLQELALAPRTNGCQTRTWCRCWRVIRSCGVWRWAVAGN